MEGEEELLPVVDEEGREEGILPEVNEGEGGEEELLPVVCSR